MKRKIFLGAMTLATIASSFLHISMASAASNALGITPRKDYTVKPGESITDQLYVNNLNSTQELSVSFRVIDFQAKDESGTPALSLQDNAPQTPWSLKPFVKLPKDVRVAPGKTALVPITVTVPSGQGAGSYYSAVQYLAQNAADQKRLNLAASSASLIFLNVPGNTTESLNMLQFGAYNSDPNGQTGSFSSLFLGGQPKELAYRVRNNGNVAEQVSGAVVVKNMFGKTVTEVRDINPKKQLALRGQTRRIAFCMKTTQQTETAPNGQQQTNQVCEGPGLWPGRYTAQLDAFYGLPGGTQQEILAKAVFWYLPWWFLLIVLVVLGAIVLAGVRLSRKLNSGGRRKSSSRRR